MPHSLTAISFNSSAVIVNFDETGMKILVTFICFSTNITTI